MSETMTPKERITVAMRNERPDRVPVTLGLSEMVPVRYFGDDYIEFFWKGDTPMWRARVETEHDRFGADAFLHVGPDAAPDDPPTETRAIKETSEEVVYEERIRTPAGDLTREMLIRRRSPLSARSEFVKDPVADRDKVLATLQHATEKDLSDIHRAVAEIGDRGHVGLWIGSPCDWWGTMRGAQTMVMDLMTADEALEPIFAAYREYAVALADYVLANTPLDSVGLGGSYTSMSLLSPALHEAYSLETCRAICEVARRRGRPVQYHMCGKSRQMLPITAAMGVDGFDALECPPTGDVDLAEVKRTFGERVSLRGNVNSITVMLNGKPADVERDVKRCMDAAKEGGGFILGVGDQTPYDVPEENLYAFVEAGLKYGGY